MKFLTLESIIPCMLDTKYTSFPCFLSDETKFNSHYYALTEFITFSFIVNANYN